MAWLHTFERPVERGLKRREIQRLCDVVVGAKANRLHRGLDRGIASDHHDHGVFLARLHLLDELEAVHFREPEVGHDEINASLLELLQSLATGRGQLGVVTTCSQDLGEQLLNLFLIINNEHSRHVGFWILDFGFLITDNGVAVPII
jgi:hypothetical protein